MPSTTFQNRFAPNVRHEDLAPFNPTPNTLAAITKNAFRFLTPPFQQHFCEVEGVGYTLRYLDRPNGYMACGPYGEFTAGYYLDDEDYFNCECCDEILDVELESEDDPYCCRECMGVLENSEPAPIYIEDYTIPPPHYEDCV